MEETSNHCSFDLYSDLIEDNFKEKEYSYSELEQKFSSVKEEAKSLRQQFEEASTKANLYQSENVILKKNISSLLNTAKCEIQRKNDEIKRLRCCLENRWRRQQRVHFPRRGSHHDLSQKGAAGENSQTGDTCDSVTDSGHSSANLGFSVYSLGKKQEERTVLNSPQSQRQKSANDRLISREAERDTGAKDNQCDKQQKEEIHRSKSAAKSVEDFVSDVRKKSEQKKERQHGKDTEQTLTEKPAERKEFDLRHRLGKRTIDVSKGRLDGRQVKSRQRCSDTVKSKETNDKSWHSAKSKNQEKENLSTSESLGSRKRRHVSDSIHSSKRTKTLNSPQKPTERNDSTLRKYLQVSPVSQAASKTAGTIGKSKTVSKVEKKNQKESKQTYPVTYSQEDIKSSKENSPKVSQVKKSSDEPASADCKSPTETILEGSKVTHCIIKHESKAERKAEMVSSVKQTQKVAEGKNNETDIAFNRQPTRSPSESEKKHSLETGLGPGKSVARPAHHKEMLADKPTKNSPVKDSDIPVQNSSDMGSECHQNIKSFKDVCEETSMLTSVGKKTDFSINSVETSNSHRINEPPTGTKLEVKPRCSDLVVFSNNCASVPPSVCSNEEGNTACKQPIESVSRSSILSMDTSECLSSDVSLESCQRTNPRRDSVCTVTSTTLWETDNGVTSWVQDVEVINGVKKYRLRALKHGDPLLSSSAESLQSSASNSSVQLSASLCLSNEDSKTAGPSKSSEVLPFQSPKKTNGFDVSDNQIDQSALSPFKTPAATPSLDKLPDTNPVNSPEAPVNSSLTNDSHLFIFLW